MLRNVKVKRFSEIYEKSILCIEEKPFEYKLKLWNELLAYLCSKLTAVDKRNIEDLFSKFYKLILKLTCESDEELLSSLSVEILKNLIKVDDHLLSTKNSIISEHGIEKNKGYILDELFDLAKSIKKAISEKDFEIVQKIEHNNLNKLLYGSLPIFGEKLKINMGIDIADKERIEIILKCLDRKDVKSETIYENIKHKVEPKNDSANEILPPSKPSSLNSLLFDISKSMNIELDDLVRNVSELLRSTKSNDEIQGSLFDLLGFESFDVISEILKRRNAIIDVSENNKVNNKHQSSDNNIIDELMNNPQAHLERKAKQLSQNALANLNVVCDKSTLSYVKYPFVFDRMADLEKMGALKISLPKSATTKSTEISEEIYIPPGENTDKMDFKKVPVSSMDEIGQLGFQGMKHLNVIQSIVYPHAYGSNENLLICAPTGAGKTNIAMLTILHQINQHIGSGGKIKTDQFKIIYVAPMKALAAEMTENFGKRLKPLGISVKECTGDMQLSKKEIMETQMIVTTPEKYDVITRKSTGDTALVQIVKLLIIDEIHLLHEERGSVIESIVARTLRQVESNQKTIRIVGLSATLPNYVDVADFLSVNPQRGLFYFDGRFRPVPLHQTLVGVKGSKPMEIDHNMDELCYQFVIKYLRKNQQVMVFVHARTATGRVARKLRDMMKERGEVCHIDEDLHGREYNLALKKLERSRDACLKDIFKDGIACHHAGMLRSDRSFVESCFKQGTLRVLVCTATLAWGVNLPAHAVIIRGTEYYDAEKSSFQDIGILDVLQIFGRAGRPQFDTEGHGLILCKHASLAHYISLLTRQYPIESKFLKSLNDNLNAEVALGTVSTTEEAARWLGYTYMFVRMRKNPLAYGISYAELRSDPDLLEIRLNIITESARQLDKARLVRFNELNGYLSSTDSGRLASHYYIHYNTASMVEEKYKSGLFLNSIFGLISEAHEFSQMKVRDDEIDELDQIRETRCHIDLKYDTSDIAGKVNTIIQAYIDRYKPESFSLVSDLNYVSQNLGRIVRYLFEKAIRSGWSIMTSTVINLCKMVEQQMWETSHPLWQFHNELNHGILERCESKKLSLDNIRSSDAKVISSIIGYGDSGREIKRLSSMIPFVEIEADVQPITRTILRIKARIIPKFQWADRYHGNSELFWVWVEDPDTDNIHYSEQISLTKKIVLSSKLSHNKLNNDNVVELIFAIPIHEPVPNMYLLRVVSDRWIGADFTHIISFQNLILPELHPPHTDLLNIRPLPLGALHNPDYEKIYNFSHFNPIQTQMFHAVYHNDMNILLGAPTGSGKTVAAELAIFRLFSKYPGKKAVYIAPLKALVRERMNEWQVKFGEKLGKKVVELTGDIAPDMKAVSQSDVIITTPEKWDGISRSWQERSFVQDVTLLVIDEIHLLGEDRGPVLEVIVSRTNFISAKTNIPVRIVGLSTALANARDLADWLHIPAGGSMGLYNFRPSVRPVQLQAHIQGFPGRHYCPRMATMNKPIYQNIKINSPTKPVLIFVSSRRQTRLTAFDLISYLAADMTPREWLNLNDSEAELVIQTARDTNLKLTLAYGIGIHHAGLHEKDRKLVEHLFLEQKIQILIATSTLAWGVNFPAHMVVVKGTEYFDGPTKRYIDYPITDVLQMMGRAGRPQFDQQGKAVIMVQDTKKEFYKRFLYEPFPVESSLLKVLPDHLSAEITAGTITSKQGAMDYITWTFFFRRLLMNPNYYNLDKVDHNSINNYLSGLVEQIINDLEESHCVEVDQNDGYTLEPGIMGRIASYYYLKHFTVRMFKERLSADTNLTDLLDILSSAHEFSELPVRHNEDQLNLTLSENVPIKLNPSTMDSPHTKSNLLLQAHFSRQPLPIADYYIDTKLVLDQAIRVVQAMIDAAGSDGNLATCLRLVQIIQMIVQGIWVPTTSPLMQLPGIDTHHIQHIRNPYTNQIISSLPELMDVVKGRYKNLKSVFSTGFEKRELDTLFEVLNRYPIMEVTLRVRSSLVRDEYDQLNKLFTTESHEIEELIRPQERSKTKQKLDNQGDNEGNCNDDELDIDEDDVDDSIQYACDMCMPNMKDMNNLVLNSWAGMAHTLKKQGFKKLWVPLGPDVECTLDITLHRINYSQSETNGIPKAHAPHFPKPKDEGYILIIADPDAKEVLGIRRVPMIRQAKTRIQMTFYSPEKKGRRIFRLYVMSDCYASLDQEVPIFLEVLDL